MIDVTSYTTTVTSAESSNCLTGSGQINVQLSVCHLFWCDDCWSWCPESSSRHFWMTKPPKSLPVQPAVHHSWCYPSLCTQPSFLTVWLWGEVKWGSTSDLLFPGVTCSSVRALPPPRFRASPPSAAQSVKKIQTVRSVCFIVFLTASHLSMQHEPNVFVLQSGEQMGQINDPVYV